MATIPRASVDYLTREINALSADAQDKVMRILGSISWRPDNIAECRELVLEALRIVMPEYTTLSAQAAADFYDAARELSIGEPLGAVAYSGYEQDKTDGAVRAFVQRVVDGKPIESFNDAVLQRIDYEMKLSAANSTVYNGERDPKSVRYARVPTGAETCDFCLMLASRGFVYRSQSTAMSHVHAECDCRVVPGWSGDEVEGYDPDSIYDRWKERISEIAAERAERNGTSESDEEAAIMKVYGDSARIAKQRNRTA